MATKDDLATRVEQCTSFLKNTLRPELEKLRQKEKVISMEIKECEELNARLGQLESKNQTSLHVDAVDLGHGILSCEAHIEDTSHVFVDVGMGFHVELTLKEALQYTQRRIRFLRYDVLKNHTEKTVSVLEHIRSTETLLDEIVQLRG